MASASAVLGAYGGAAAAKALCRSSLQALTSAANQHTACSWARAPQAQTMSLCFQLQEVLHESYVPAGAQLPPNVTWAPVAELPPFQEQLLRAANTPRDLRKGAFALGLTRSVRKSLSEASSPFLAIDTFRAV